MIRNRIVSIALICIWMVRSSACAQVEKPTGAHAPAPAPSTSPAPATAVAAAQTVTVAFAARSVSPELVTSEAILDLSAVSIPRELRVREVPASSCLTRDQAVAVALRDNPGLKAARDQIEAARGDYVHSSAASDPTLSFGGSWVPHVRPAIDSPNIQDFPDEDVTNLTVVFPTSGRRFWATLSAEGRFDAARSVFDGARRALMTATKTAYAGLEQSQEVWLLNADVYRIAASLLVLTQRAFQAGAVRQLDVLQAQIALAQARQGLISSRFDILAKEAALNFQLGRSSKDRLGASDPLRAWPVALSLPSLVKLGYAQRSEIRADRATLAGLRAQVGVAKADRRPDTTVVSSYVTHTTNSTGIPITAQLTAPLYDRGQIGGNVIQARASVCQAEQNLEQDFVVVFRDVQTAYASVQADIRSLQISQDVLMPRTLDLLKRTRLGFFAGANTLLDVLNAQQAYRQTAIAYVGAAAKLAQDIATLESAVNGPVERVEGPGIIRGTVDAFERLDAARVTEH